MPFSLSSPAFANTGQIPVRHSCQGAEVAPPLAWTDPPPHTRAYALVVDDPDAPDPKRPTRVWVHWVLWDIPASATGLPEGAPLPAETRVGRNDAQTMGYVGPCPPIGRHRYFFTLYALDAPLGPLEPPTKAQLLSAMRGHVLASAHLMGTYEMRP